MQSDNFPSVLFHFFQKFLDVNHKVNFRCIPFKISSPLHYKFHEGREKLISFWPFLLMSPLICVQFILSADSSLHENPLEKYFYVLRSNFIQKDKVTCVTGLISFHSSCQKSHRDINENVFIVCIFIMLLFLFHFFSLSC